MPVSPIGRYVETDSVIHRLDARTKAVCLLLAIAACLSVSSAWSLAMVLALFLLVVVSSRVRLDVAVGSVRLVVFLVALAAVLNGIFWQPQSVPAFFVRPGPTLAGVLHGLLVGLRLVLMVGFVNLFLLTTPPAECSEAVAFFVSPLRKLVRSAAAVPMVVMIALRFLPVVIAEGNRVSAAQRSRGMRSGKGLVGRARELRPLVVPLFRGVLRRASELSVALEVRCFDPYRARRGAFASRFGFKDASALVCSLAVLGLVRLVG